MVLLGASNLTRGLPTVLGLIAPRVGPRDRILVAAGYGRSYGAASYFLARRLPPILACELWRQVAADRGATWLALADVGNDLAYGYSPETVASWVEACVERLEPEPGRGLLVLLPQASLERLPGWRYALVRGLLFPGRRLPRRRLLAAVAELNQRLRELADRRGLLAVAPDPAWLGPDAIHFRRRQQRRAWARLLAGWGPLPAESAPLAPGPLIPARRSILGVRLHRPQPTTRLPGGTPVGLY